MPDRKKIRTNNKSEKESKICVGCGLEFHNRKKWDARGLWPTVQYCSERCRRTARKVGTDQVSTDKHE